MHRENRLPQGSEHGAVTPRARDRVRRETAIAAAIELACACLPTWQQQPLDRCQDGRQLIQMARGASRTLAPPIMEPAGAGGPWRLRSRRANNLMRVRARVTEASADRCACGPVHARARADEHGSRRNEDARPRADWKPCLAGPGRGSRSASS